MIDTSDNTLSELTRELDALGTQYDRTGDWPQKSVDLIAGAGAWKWNLPAAYGGDPVCHKDLLRVYAALSAGCMSTALISTQRDGAVELLAGCDNDALKSRWLPSLARGEVYTTVGISQLTTSKRGGGRTLMTATPDGDGYRLDGMMPWATGAEQAAVVVTGAVLPDGRQILAAVPTDRPGLRVDQPDELFVLTCSRTSCVHCDNYRVEPDELIRGPADKVLSLRTPVKPLVTSACGIGVATALHDVVVNLPEAARRPFDDVVQPLLDHYRAVRESLLSAADGLDDPAFEAPSTRIRVQVNALLVRLAMTTLTLAKGSAFLTCRPVQRHVREAMFFLVWSATGQTQLETLARLMAPLPVDSK